MTQLFRLGHFTLHSGDTSTFKIDCDALSDHELEACVAQLLPLFGTPRPFEAVHGIPRGGVRLAQAFSAVSGVPVVASHTAAGISHSCPIPLLIVDDVLTTGSSMDARYEGFTEGFARVGRWDPRSWDTPVYGAVLFARGKCPDWVVPLFRMPAA